MCATGQQGREKREPRSCAAPLEEAQMSASTHPTSAAMAVPTQKAGELDRTALRPFRVSVPEEDLLALRLRLAATRWPHKELVADRSQGVQLATIQELVRYWTTEHDWRACEA